MGVVQTLKLAAAASIRNPDRFFEVAKKRTVIQLRWTLVILCSYLLLYAPNSWLAPAALNAVLIFYLLTNATLYFVADDFFDSSYFYRPLLAFDTLFLAFALISSGGGTTDFYVACLMTVVLSCICSDSRGLFVVTLLAPSLYAYVVLSSAITHDVSVYLKLLFPLVIAMFYGYFARVERLKRQAKENEEQARQQQKATEKIKRQRERLEALHEVNVAVTSSIDSKTVLETFLKKALAYLPYAAAMVRLRHDETGLFETAATQGFKIIELEASPDALGALDELTAALSPVRVRSLWTDPRSKDFEVFRREGLVSLVALPVVANGTGLGSLIFLTREEHFFGEEELEFLSTLTRSLAVALNHSQLFNQIRRQASALRQANQIKDEFLGVVSQELKTPLNVISGYSSMLTEGKLGEMTPIQERALQTVSRQSKELHNLINSVIQMSSIETETLQAEFQEVNFWEFLSELRAFYDYPLGKDVKLVWELRTDLPVLFADRGKLRHILENLINNAIKFTDQGSVTISARFLASRKMMEFKVADTGLGIPRELLPGIFERFRHADSSDARLYGGTGLGLYIAKKYANVLGGTLHVESKLGHGSVFALRIPCQLPAVSLRQEQLSFPIKPDSPKTLSTPSI